VKTHEAYAEIWAEVLSTNRYLKLALGALALLCIGLLMLCWRTFDRFEHLSPLVVRIDEVGRAEAVRYEAAAYVPDVAKPEVKYFLRRFVVLHRERRRDAVLDSWQRSLLFLDGPLGRRLMQEQEEGGELVRFLGGQGPEIEIAIDAVQVQPSREEPYMARVDFTETLRDLSGRVSGVRRWTSEFEFRFLAKPPRELLAVNPLGLSITYFRSDRIED
jgi:type IV secretion system protein VirB5